MAMVSTSHPQGSDARCKNRPGKDRKNPTRGHVMRRGGCGEDGQVFFHFSDVVPLLKIIGAKEHFFLIAGPIFFIAVG